MKKHYPDIVDSYFGPKKIQAAVEASPAKLLEEISEDIGLALEAIPETPPLKDLTLDYLRGQFGSLATFVAQEINLRHKGEPLYSYPDYASRILQTTVKPIPEEFIMQQRERAEQLLRVRYRTGSFEKQFHGFWDEDLIGGESEAAQAEFMRVFKESIALYRQITAEHLLRIPQNDVPQINDKYRGGAIAYIKYTEGEVLVNPLLARQRQRVKNLCKHEIWPGHWANYAMRAEHLKEHPLANCFVFCTPESIPMEGLGEYASDLIAPFLPPAERNHEDELLNDAISQWRSAVAHNATLLYFERNKQRDPAEKYLSEVGLYDERECRGFFGFRDSIFDTTYTLSYYYGYQLIKDSYKQAKARGKEKDFLLFAYQNQLTPQMVRDWIRQME